MMFSIRSDISTLYLFHADFSIIFPFITGGSESSYKVFHVFTLAMQSQFIVVNLVYCICVLFNAVKTWHQRPRF